MVTTITISQFQSEWEKGNIKETFSVTVNAEKRVYGKLITSEGEKGVYAVVP